MRLGENSEELSALVRQVEPPADARALSTLDRIDYADTFLVDTRGQQPRTGEQWARLILDGAPAALRASLPGSWRSLGLKHGKPGDRHCVLGWPVEHSGTDYALLSAQSRVGMPGQLLFLPRGDELLFATFVQHRNPAARAVWAGVVPAHRRVVRQLLQHAIVHAQPTPAPVRDADS